MNEHEKALEYARMLSEAADDAIELSVRRALDVRAAEHTLARLRCMFAEARREEVAAIAARDAAWNQAREVVQ